MSAGPEKSKASRKPMRLATSQMIHQSGFASPGARAKARWRDIRRSELVTVPSFSPQPAAGRHTSAPASVSVADEVSETTTNGHSRSALLTTSASGMESTGLVAMIQIALMRSLATARNMSTALRPGLVAILLDDQKRET